MWGVEIKERGPTILFTPCTKFLPNMGGRKVKKVTHDGVPSRARWQTRTRAPSSQTHERDASDNGGGRREARVIIHHVKDWSKYFHL